MKIFTHKEVLSLLHAVFLLLFIIKPVFSAENHHDDDEHTKKEDHHDEHSKHNDGQENNHHNKDKDHDHENKESDDHHDEHDDHGDSSVGADKAITKIEDEGNHFWLSEEAEKRLSLSSVVFSKTNNNGFKLPNSAIVHFRYQAGIYIKENGGYKFVKCKIVKKSKKNSVVQIKISHQKIDAITVGTALLRVAHLQATGQGGKGHVH